MLLCGYQIIRKINTILIHFKHFCVVIKYCIAFRKLDLYTGHEYYTGLLDEYINFTIDEERTRVQQMKDARDTRTTKTVLQKTAVERTPGTELKDLSGDEINALKLLQTRRVALRELLTSKTIETLDEKSCLQSLEEWGLEQAKDPKAFRLPPFNFHRLKAMTDHPANSVKQRAVRIREIQIRNNRAMSGQQYRGGKSYQRGRRY